jgi:hypothetical protein
VQPTTVDPDIKGVGEPSGPAVELRRRAELLLLSRRRRLEIFDRQLFDEAAWDTLLVLYVEEASRPSLTTSELAQLIGAPIQVLRRWIDYLDQLGLVAHQPSPFREHGSVRISSKGRADLELYLSAVAGADSQ